MPEGETTMKLKTILSHPKKSNTEKKR